MFAFGFIIGLLIVLAIYAAWNILIWGLALLVAAIQAIVEHFSGHTSDY